MSDAPDVSPEALAEKELTPSEKKLLDKHGMPWEPVGPIHISGEINGSYTFARAVEFDTADEMNAFFESMTNVVVVKVFARGDSIFVLYTRELTREELEDIQEWDKQRRNFFAQRAAERREKKRSELLEEHKKAEETERLAEAGKKCLDHHGHLVKQLRKLRQGKLSAEDAATLDQAMGADDADSAE
jgi:hypothetical protein